MNGLPYYKAYPRDFIEGTIGMPFELKAAYRLVLDLIYMQGGKLPDDARYIAGLLGCSVRKWNGFRQELINRGKINIIDGSISNDRAIIELESLAKVQDKQRENRARPNKNKDLEAPRFDHTEPDTDTERVKQLTDIPERCARDVGLSDPPDDLKSAFNGSTDALLELVATHLGNDRRAAEHWLGNLLAQCGATAVLGAYQQLLTARGTNQPIARPIQYLSKTAASLKVQPTPSKAAAPRRSGQPVPIAIPKASPEEIARTMRVLQADWSIPEH